MSKEAPISNKPEFDQFAEGYDAALEQGLSASGESKEFFAEGRANWLRRELERLGHRPERILDFGCGTGSATPYLLGLPGAASLVGVEVSAESVKVARRSHGSERASFCLATERQPRGEFDLAFCNGVFHHIPPNERATAVSYVRESLRPGGVFAFWENNPWNPGTRYVMSRIAFDRNAIMLAGGEAARMLQQGGFDVLRTDFVFIFPRALKWLRPLEALLSGLPLGGQYMVLARKP